MPFPDDLYFSINENSEVVFLSNHLRILEQMLFAFDLVDFEGMSLLYSVVALDKFLDIHCFEECLALLLAGEEKIVEGILKFVGHCG